MISETEWANKYKSALLERNPVLLNSRIKNAREAIALRLMDPGVGSAERQALEHAVAILSSLEDWYLAEDS
ncbi:MAG TPA: hypothetical protein VF753_04590 [Terriglobales bacterium]